MAGGTRNTLYYGDCYEVLKKHLPDESIDLVYLDPPFNSNRDYNVLFKEQTGAPAEAQVKAFTDTWKWSPDLYAEWDGFVDTCPNQPLVSLMQSFIQYLKRNDVTAYLARMTPRLYELHRVLKPTGSLYLHCDPAASHYLKIILDLIFGPGNFRNEVVWKRSNAHNDARRYGRIHDVILYYVRSAAATWNDVFTEYSESYIAAEWKRAPSGRLYKTDDMTDPRKRMAEYDFMGTIAQWRTGPAGMQELWDAEQTEVPLSHGRIKTDVEGRPLKRCRITFLDERQGVKLQDMIVDIPNVRGGKSEAFEHLGYPTQKPVGPPQAYPRSLI